MKAHARLSPRTISTSWATYYFNNIGAERTSAKERGCLSAANCGHLVVTSGYQDGLLSVRRFLETNTVQVWLNGILEGKGGT